MKKNLKLSKQLIKLLKRLKQMQLKKSINIEILNRLKSRERYFGLKSSIGLYQVKII